MLRAVIFGPITALKDVLLCPAVSAPCAGVLWTFLLPIPLVFSVFATVSLLKTKALFSFCAVSFVLSFFSFLCWFLYFPLPPKKWPHAAASLPHKIRKR